MEHAPIVVLLLAKSSLPLRHKWYSAVAPRPPPANKRLRCPALPKASHATTSLEPGLNCQTSNIFAIESQN